MSKNEQAIQAMKEKDYELAIKLFSEYIDEYPTDPLGYINLSNLFIQLGEYSHAEKLLKRAIELDQSAASAYYTLGNNYFEQNLYDDAKQQYELALHYGLKDSDVYYMIGLTLNKQSLFLLAIPYLLRATELAPEDIEKQFQYGLTLAKANYVDEAEHIFTHVLKSDSKHVDALYNLGVIYFNRGNYSLSLSYFDQALQLNPNHTLAKNGKQNVENAILEKRD